MGFQDRLKDLRQLKNLTQRELAETIFVSRSAIAKWENGLGVPSEANLKMLCEFFNVDEDWLLDRADLKAEIKTVKKQLKNVAVSICGIIFPIVFLTLFLVPLFNHYYDPNQMYPLVYYYYPPLSIMDILGVAWQISVILLWAATVLFSVLNISLFQFKKSSMRCVRINSVMVVLSAVIFIIVLVVSVFVAMQFDYRLPI